MPVDGAGRHASKRATTGRRRKQRQEQLEAERGDAEMPSSSRTRKAKGGNSAAAALKNKPERKAASGQQQQQKRRSGDEELLRILGRRSKRAWAADQKEEDGEGEIGLKMVPLYRDLIFAIPDFLTAEECSGLIDFCEQQGFERAFQSGARKYDAFRDNDRLLIPSENVSDLLWQRLAPHVPQIVNGRRAQGCNPNLRFYKYSEGQKFGQHIDESVEDESRRRSEFTVLIYLNGGSRSPGLRGGETAFYKGKGQGAPVLEFAPEMGSALLHGHGQRCLLHEGKEVIQGTKYLLRTDVMFA